MGARLIVTVSWIRLKDTSLNPKDKTLDKTFSLQWGVIAMVSYWPFYWLFHSTASSNR